MSDLKLPLISRAIINSDSQSSIPHYDPFAIPPSIQIAKNHGLATRTSRIPKYTSVTQVCPCCHLPIQNQIIPISCKVKEMAHIGVAYCLYFQYIKLVFIMVCCNIVLSGLAQLGLNTTGNMCKKLHNNTFICQSSVINILNIKDTTMVQIQNILNCLFILVSFVLIEGFKVKLDIYKLKYKSKVHLIEDYSILIDNIPCHPSISTDSVMSLVSKTLEGSDCTPEEKKVIKTYFLLDMSEYVRHYEQQFQIVEEIVDKESEYDSLKKQVLTNNNSTNSSKMSNHDLLDQVDAKLAEIKKLQETKKQIQQKMETFEEDLYKQYKLIDSPQGLDSANSNIRFSGRCIVTFNSKKARRYMVAHPPNSHNVRKFDNPTDVRYSTLGQPDGQTKVKFSKRALGMLIVALIFDFLFLTLLKKFIKVEQSTAINPIRLAILSAISSIICCGFNTLLGIMIRYYARKNPNYVSVSDYFLSIGNQLTTIFMINMIATTYFSNLVSFWIIDYGESTYPHFPLNFIGLIYDFFFLFITNSYMSSVMSYFDIVWGWRLNKRRLIKKNLNVCQAEANYYFENHPIDLALRYANVNKAILVSAAMAPIIPIGLEFTLLALVILYWIDKWLFLNRFTIKHKLSSHFTRQIFKQLELYPLFLSFFNMLIMFIPVEEESSTTMNPFIYPNNQDSFAFYMSIAVFLLSVWYYFSKKGYINRVFLKIFDESFKYIHDNDELYEDCKEKFAEDYSDNYPYFNMLHKKGERCFISDIKIFEQFSRGLDENRYQIKQ